MGLYENLQSEPVSELTLREAAVTGPGTTIRDTILRMREKKVGCAIVVDDDNKPQGMFTERMLVQLLNHHPGCLDEPIENHTADQWPWVRLSDPIVTVLDAMQLNNVRFLCVVDDEGRLTGLTGQKGLMEYVAEHFPGQVMVQRIGGKPYPQNREGA